MDKENLILAANLALQLKEKGISKSELAREMDVTRQTVQVWLKKGSVSRKNLSKLAEYFDISVSSLVGQSDIVISDKEADLIKREIKELIEAIPANHVLLLQYLKKMLS